MMKRLMTLTLALLLAVCAVSAAFAAERTPRPIRTIPYDELPEVVDGQHHYLLLCVDEWHANPNKKPGQSGYLGNTDGIVLVTLDERAHRVMLTSFIREELVVRPDGHIGRINYIAKNYGPEALCRVISEHIGVRIEKYILFDFSQIQSIIDHLGGVDITITAEEANYLKRYSIPPDSTKPRIRGAGTYHFNGHSAVIYMRIRKVGGGGDFMRTQRVRTVLSTLADQCRSISYDEARTLVDAVLQNSTMTNMNVDEAVTAMEQAYGLRECTIEELRIPPDGAATPITYAGMSTQEVNWDVCRATFADYLENSFVVLTDDDEDGFDDFGSFGGFGD